MSIHEFARFCHQTGGVLTRENGTLLKSKGVCSNKNTKSSKARSTGENAHNYFLSSVCGGSVMDLTFLTSKHRQLKNRGDVLFYCLKAFLMVVCSLLLIFLVAESSNLIQ